MSKCHLFKFNFVSLTISSVIKFLLMSRDNKQRRLKINHIFSAHQLIILSPRKSTTTPPNKPKFKTANDAAAPHQASTCQSDRATRNRCQVFSSSELTQSQSSQSAGSGPASYPVVVASSSEGTAEMIDGFCFCELWINETRAWDAAERCSKKYFQVTIMISIDQKPPPFVGCRSGLVWAGWGSFFR